MFSNEKAARANAAGEVTKHITDHGLTKTDGSVKFKEKLKLGMVVRVEEEKLESKGDATYTQRRI